MHENYFDASVRHWYDAQILEDAGEYDNAVCMQGFAAECALKSIFQQCISRENVVKYGHNIKLLLQDILRMNIIARKMLLSVGRMHQPICRKC